MSQRKIADIVGCGQKTVSRLLGTEVESNKPMVKMTQEETLEVEGGENERSVKIPQEEDTSSVFTHCTSVEPVANPWVCLTI
jgi:DNA transposition AAA+ family ATPase